MKKAQKVQHAKNVIHCLWIHTHGWIHTHIFVICITYVAISTMFQNIQEEDKHQIQE